MYTVSSFWALAHCALSRHHIFHLVGSGTLESPHTFPCCLLKVLLITKPQPSQVFFFLNIILVMLHVTKEVKLTRVIMNL